MQFKIEQQLSYHVFKGSSKGDVAGKLGSLMDSTTIATAFHLSQALSSVSRLRQRKQG